MCVSVVRHFCVCAWSAVMMSMAIKSEFLILVTCVIDVVVVCGFHFSSSICAHHTHTHTHTHTQACTHKHPLQSQPMTHTPKVHIQIGEASLEWGHWYIKSWKLLVRCQSSGSLPLPNYTLCKSFDSYVRNREFLICRPMRAENHYVIKSMM